MASRPTPPAASLTAAILLAGLPVATAYSQLQIAEELLINLDANTYTTGSPWTNAGTLGTTFNPGNTPTRMENLAGATGVFFDRADYFLGPISTPTLHDAQASYSIEAWAYNGYIQGEESLVAWGSRGGPDGTNVSFNYGNHGTWGAMGHWGAGPDMGWGALEGGAPARGQWHHLAYTYDGAGTQRVFVNGVNTNTETGVTLDPKDSFPIQLGAQREGDDTVATANTFGGALSKVRVHAGTLTEAQIANNYNFEKAQFQLQVQQLPAGPVNRYTFNGLTSSNDFTIVPDVAGGMDAVIRGSGATLTPDGKGVDLPGGSSATAAYIDLPNGVVSGFAHPGTGFTSASYEAWVTVQSNQNWSRIMDFGASANAEVFGPGGAGNGTNYIFLGPNVGTDNNMVLDRGGDAGIGGAPVGGGQRQAPGATTLGIEMHVVMLYDGDAQEWRWYQNGVLMEGFSSIGGPTTINDLNNWLGRSQWGGDANLDGIFNEFRIYDYALDQEQIAGNFQAGPDVVNLIPEPASALLFGFGAMLLGMRRRRQL